MSTYLMAIAIGEFDYVEGRTAAGVRIRSWATPGEINAAPYSVNIGVKCLDFLENYTGIKYPLPKLDMIAFNAFGAMENWGLLTFRPHSLLYSELFSPLINKYKVATTVAHEISHQKDYIATEVMESALVRDRSEWRSLNPEVKDPGDFGRTFTTLYYDKGASFIAMVAALIGEENFNEGLKHYLTKFSYGNTRSTDLWESLENTKFTARGPDGNPLNLKAFASPWTTQVRLDILIGSVIFGN
ncbi:unnamed protein product [Haemonchus placei]|uniref:Peptidase_M1 domain-containing protein n=1 Tax=Haemonchus placei TaxID=6290 RepID=A0A158QKW2_HAEPC|nr:unnamed protein product [Haemonchus placei]